MGRKVSFVSGFYPETDDAQEALRQFMAILEKGVFTPNSICDLPPTVLDQFNKEAKVVAFPGVKPPALKAEEGFKILQSVLGDSSLDFSKPYFITSFQRFKWPGSDDRAEAGMIFMDLLIYKRKPRFFIEFRVTLNWLEDPRSPEALQELEKIEKACGLKFDPKKIR